MRAKAGLTIAAIALAAASGSAAGDAARPQRIARGRDLGLYTLAGNAAGERLVLVRRDEDLRDTGWDVFSAAPGAQFGSTSKLRGDDVPADPISTAVGPDGTAVLVGQARPPLQPPDRGWLRAMVRPPGGQFGRPEKISAPEVDEAEVGFDHQGVALAIWTRFHGKREAVAVEESSIAPGGDWSTPTVIADERRGAHDAHVAFDAAGGAVAVWSRDGSPEEAEAVAGGHAKRQKRRFKTEVVAATRPAGGRWGRPQVLSDPRFDSDEASLSVNAAGQAAVSWVLNTPGDKHFRIGAAFREPGKRFGSPHFLTPDGRDSYGTSMALDDKGRALVVWTIVGDRPDMESGANQVVAAIRPPGGPLGKPVKLSDRHTGFPEMAMSPDGHAVVTWVRESRRGYLVQARRVNTAGAYGPIEVISPRGYIDELDVIVDGGGDALVTWKRDARHDHLLEAATLSRRQAGATSAVQKAQRRASDGISLRHSGHLRVLGGSTGGSVR